MGDLEIDARDRLLNRLAAEHQIERSAVTKTEFRFNDLVVSIWHLKDPNSMLDDATLLASHRELEWQPYWAQVWDAAVGLAGELVSRELSDLRILDLGCGLGVPGAVAAARGAEVVLADHAPPALIFAELNSLPWRERVAVTRLDWRTDRLDQQFDWILASDIVYDPDDMETLAQFWDQHLRPGGRVWVAEPSRAMTGRLMQALAGFGWLGDWSRHRVAGLLQPIRIWQLVRDNSSATT